MKPLRAFDSIRNARFAETCKRLKLEDNEAIRDAFWAGVACGLLEQLLDDARMTEETARHAFTDYLKGASKL